MTRPRSSGRSRSLRPDARLLLLAALVSLVAACAGRLAVAPPAVVDQARRAPSYSARLRVSLKGPLLRARTAVLVAFRRPDALRIEVPGPAGARLVAVARGERLWAVFPAERAVFTGAARADDLASLLGVALSPGEVMDLLVGAPPPRLRSYRAAWGPSLPREIRATLPDGARLSVAVDDAEAPAVLGETAFAEPPHEGYRAITADQARTLWSR